MNLGDLIRRFRTLALDRIEPYLWPDDEVIAWLSDAQREAAIRGRLLHEDANASVCRIGLTPGAPSYPLHRTVIEITNARIIPGDGSAPRPLTLVSRDWLNANMSDWRDNMDCLARFAVQDETRLRVVGRIATGDVLAIECYRTPLKDLADEDDKPEIHVAHHEYLVQWALYRAFSVPDSDKADAARSAAAKDVFTSYFGARPDSDMRRATRADVPHHNEAVLP